MTRACTYTQNKREKTQLSKPKTKPLTTETYLGKKWWDKLKTISPTSYSITNKYLSSSHNHTHYSIRNKIQQNPQTSKEQEERKGRCVIFVLSWPFPPAFSGCLEVAWSPLLAPHRWLRFLLSPYVTWAPHTLHLQGGWAGGGWVNYCVGRLCESICKCE